MQPGSRSCVCEQRTGESRGLNGREQGVCLSPGPRKKMHGVGSLGLSHGDNRNRERGPGSMEIRIQANALGGQGSDRSMC